MNLSAVDLYPTKPATVSKMLAGIKLDEVGSILEPSAGKGNICDYINEHWPEYNYHRSERDIDVVEIDYECQCILKGKGYRLIHDDFLTFETHKAYGLIVANFPFSAGAEHLQKAISMLERSGGHLRCLVNAETIRNPYTNLRQSLIHTLDRLGAEVEYLEDEFVDAERQTSVEVALIKLSVEKKPEVSIILDSMEKAEEEKDGPQFQDQSIIERDYKKGFVARFNLEARLGIQLIDEWLALKPHILDRIKRPDYEGHDHSKPIIKLDIEGAPTYSSGNRTEYVNNYLHCLRSKYWELLIHHPEFSRNFTSNILEELSVKLKELRDYDFNLFNIAELEKELKSNIITGIEQAILKMFDEFSTKYAWDESIHNGNVHYYNGWKSNKAHKINKKIVLPMNGLDSGYDTKRPLRWSYYIDKRLSDMVKVFHYLGQADIDVTRKLRAEMNTAEHYQNFRNLDCVYFEATFFKKGTCHIKFKDERLLDKFNIFGSQRRGWLPPCYGKKPYEEMDTEEKAVVDSFQGEEKYREVMKRTDYYLVETSQLLLGTSRIGIG